MLLWAFNAPPPPKIKPVNFYHKNETIIIHTVLLRGFVLFFSLKTNKQALELIHTAYY